MQSLQKQLDFAFDLVSKPDTKSIKQGEMNLTKLKSNAEYPLLLIAYMKDSPAFDSKLRAAIQLKLWCEKYKNMEQFERNAYSHLKDAIQENIVSAFFNFNGKIQQTIMPGIVSLAAVEFPDNWKNLISELIKNSSDNPSATLKVLQLMSQITIKYTYLSRSDPLYHQIIIVCNEFHGYLLRLTQYSIENILMNQNNPEHVRILEQQMILFYNLNYQDLHPNFEDNLPEWMRILNKVMQLPNLNEKFFKCKGAALQSILLYANKYKDDVEESIKGFMQQIWTLCANASNDPQYDEIVTNALKYFKSLLPWQDMRQNFASNIDNLISNLILPNLNLSQTYKAMFQEDIESFLSYFFRNAQTMTRRSNAIELLQSIVRQFNQNFQSFLDTQVRGFQPGPDNMNMQCLLLTLVIESAPKGFRDADGVTSLQYNQSIISFCYQQFVKSTLNSIYSKTSASNSKPIEKQLQLIQLLTTLRFIYYFRIYIPTSELDLILRLCCTMNVQNQSLKEVVILMVSAIVTIKHGDFLRYQNILFYYDPDKLIQVAPDVLTMIATYEKETEQLNPGLNRLLFSVVKQLKQHNDKLYDSHISPIIKSMLCKTQTFTFSSVLPLFEAIGYLAYYLTTIKSSKSNDLQLLIQQYFHQMIKMESDMLNFCFQVLSIFLRYNAGNMQFYSSIYSSIIRPENWTYENLSLISSYLQYIASYLTLHRQNIINDKEYFQQILTKLIELEHYELFYRLLRCILKLSNLQGFHQYGYMEILIKGTNFIAQKVDGRKMGLLFLFQLMYDYDVNLVIKSINSIQNGFVENFILSCHQIIKTMQVLRNRKLMFGSICNALAVRSISSVQNEAAILSLLIQNTTGRFKRDAFLSSIQPQTAIKKQSTYQKLAVFKEIDSDDQRGSISLDEDLVLMQTYTICANNNPEINNFINQKNMERIKKIYEKNQNSGNLKC